MNLPIWVPLLVVFSIIMNIIVIVLILKKSVQANHTITKVLVGSLITISIWVFTVYLQLEFFTINGNLIDYTTVATISNISILIGLILLATFWELLVEPNPNFIQIGYLSSLASVVFGFAFLSIFAGMNNDLTVVKEAWDIADIFNILIVVSVIIFINSNLKRIFSENLSARQRAQIKNLRNGLLFGFLTGIPFIFLSRFVDTSFTAIFFVIVAITLYFFVRAYLIEPRVAFILPHRTYLITVVSKNGLLKYSKNFMNETRNDNKTLLVSMGLSAVNSMLSDFYKTSVSPKIIAFEKQMILFHTLENYFIAAFTDRDSLLIRQAMTKMAEMLAKTYLKDDLSKIMDSPVIMDLDEITDKAFFFIYQ